MWNLLTTPNLFLREAFDALEGEKFFDFSIKGFNGKNSIDAAFKRFEQLIDKGRLSRLSGLQPVAIIYGAGGGHRYFVYADGNIVFSTRHCSCTCRGSHDSAVERGFEVLH